MTFLAFKKGTFLFKNGSVPFKNSLVRTLLPSSFSFLSSSSPGIQASPSPSPSPSPDVEVSPSPSPDVEVSPSPSPSPIPSPVELPFLEFDTDLPIFELSRFVDVSSRVFIGDGESVIGIIIGDTVFTEAHVSHMPSSAATIWKFSMSCVTTLYVMI